MLSKKAAKNYKIFTVDLTLTKLTSNRRWRFRNFLWPSYKTWTINSTLSGWSRIFKLFYTFFRWITDSRASSRLFHLDQCTFGADRRGAIQCCNQMLENHVQLTRTLFNYACYQNCAEAVPNSCQQLGYWDFAETW